MFEYGRIHEGSYFGDISLLHERPEEFSYYYNPFSANATQLISIEG